MKTIRPSQVCPPPSSSQHSPRHSTQSPRYHGLIAAYIILILGFCLRIYRLDAQAFTGDEAFTIVNWTQATLTHLLTTIATIDPQPPLALLSLYGWTILAGTTEFAARMLSVLAGTVTLAAAYSIARHFTTQRGALLALLLCATNPFILWHSQDARPYSLWIAVSALTLLLFLSVSGPNPRARSWLAYTLLAASTMYTFYLEAFVLIAQNIYMAYRCYHHRQLLKPWILSQIGILILISPWYLRPELRASQYQPTAAMPDIPQAIAVLTFGDGFAPTCNTLNLPWPNLCDIVPLALAATSLTVLCLIKPPRTALLILTYTVIPVTMLSALTLLTQRGYFRPRYIASTALPLTLAIALLIDSTVASRKPTPSLSKILATTTAAIVLTISSITLTNYYYNPTQAKAPNWKALALTLQAQTSPSDIVIFNYPDPAFVHYVKGPADLQYLPVTANPPQQEMDHTIRQLLTTHNYLWFVPVYVPTWDGQQTVAHALDSQAQLISDQWIDRTHLRQYAAWQISSDQIQNPLEIPIGDLALLAGYRLTPPQQFWSPGTTINLEIFWKPLHHSQTDLTVFSHLLGPIQPNGSPLWSQDDYPPQDGHTTTRSWPLGSIIRDTYTLLLPNVSSPTTYTITIGLYDPQTNERYPLNPTVPQAEPNGATLLTFTLQPTTK